MTGHLILGIDPGLDGALAFVHVDSGALVAVFDVPTLKLKNGRVLNEYQVGALVDEWRDGIAEAWIEKAWPRPGEGGVNSFAFGKNYGELRGAVTANFIPLHEVGPALWKRIMGVTADKDEARLAASRMWPHSAAEWPLKKHHGRAEAALIAAYGRKQFHVKHRVEPLGVAHV
jgi:crossover junction endodeoxyribonuclease RuvC